jgi:hypothetical protein
MDLIAKTSEDASSDVIPVIVSRLGDRLALKVAKGKLGAFITTQFGLPNRDSEVSEKSKSNLPE